jgi:hypothetical protein
MTVLRIKSAAGAERAVYRLNLTKHHEPATTRNDLIDRWESWRWGAFVCFNLNQFTGEESGGYDYDPLGKSCWFTYGEGRSFAPSRPFPAEALARKARQGWERGAHNVLLAAAPDHTGGMRPEDVEQLKSLGRLLTDTLAPTPEPADLLKARPEAIEGWSDLRLHLVINNRCGLPGDFDTPEQKLGGFQLNRPWETCMTLGTQWSWKPDDEIKSLKQCIDALVTVPPGDRQELDTIIELTLDGPANELK